MIKPYKILFLFSLICAISIIAMEKDESFSEENVENARPQVSTTNNFASTSKFNIQGSDAAKEIAKAIMSKGDWKIIFLKETLKGIGGGIGGGIAQNMANTGERALKHILPTPEEIRSKTLQNGEIITQALGLVLTQMQIAKEFGYDDHFNILKQQYKQLKRAQIIYFNDIEKLVTGKKLIAVPRSKKQQHVPIPENTVQQENSETEVEENLSEDIDDEYRKLAAKLVVPGADEPQG